MRVALAVATFLTICTPAVVHAQAAPPLFVLAPLYDAQTRATAEGGVLIPLEVGERGQKGEWGQNGKFVDCFCLEVLGGLGVGGARFAIGPAVELAPLPFLWFGADALVTVTRTFDSPGHGRPSTTYVGGEFGLLAFGIRGRIGVAHAVSGPGPQSTIVTGSIGLRLQW